MSAGTPAVAAIRRLFPPESNNFPKGRRMVAYNSQAQFAPDVESGKKRQTIRAEGKRPHARPGDVLQRSCARRYHTQLHAAAVRIGLRSKFNPLARNFARR